MFFEFLLTAILIELTPGPNMAWLALLGASRGRIAALGAVAGIALGLAIAGAAAAFGVSALIGKTPWVFQALRWAGALYLLYLAWDAWQQADGTHNGNFNEPIGTRAQSANTCRRLSTSTASPTTVPVA